MILLARLAFLNLFRHRLRTFLNVVMVGCAFLFMVCFHGFASFMLESLKKTSTESLHGHFQIASRFQWDQLPVDIPRERYLTNEKDIIGRLKKNPAVESVTPRNQFYGLISFELSSIAAAIQAYDPFVEKSLMENYTIKEGVSFPGKEKYELMLGKGLQKRLQAKVGESLNIVTQTADGSTNAISATLVGVFAAGIAEVDDSTAYLNLPGSERLLDIDEHQTLVVRLKDLSMLDIQLREIQNAFMDFPDLVLKSWYDLATMYRQVQAFFAVQDTLVELIFALLIFFGLMNTIGASIFERTGEIGTLRALGDRESDVLKIFLCEIFFQALLGLIIFLPLTLLVIQVINTISFPITMPLATEPMALRLEPQIHHYLRSALVVFIASLLAGWIPARRGSKTSIVEALRKNIN